MRVNEGNYQAQAVAQAKATVASANLALLEEQRQGTQALLELQRSGMEGQPGSYVQSGSEIGTLYSTDSVEVTISLSEQQWSSLPSCKKLINSRWPVTLTDISKTHQWH